MVSPLPCCGIMICSKRPVIVPARRYIACVSDGCLALRSEDIWRGKQQLTAFNNKYKSLQLLTSSSTLCE